MQDLISVHLWIADLSEVVLRKEVDMEDFFRRYDLEPLVKTENLDAGKRVLQKVCEMLPVRSALSWFKYLASVCVALTRRICACCRALHWRRTVHLCSPCDCALFVFPHPFPWLHLCAAWRGPNADVLGMCSDHVLYVSFFILQN